VAMVDAAERDGLLKPGGTIVEPTSGNTGVGLAIVAAQRGYRCIFVMSDKMSDEKVALLRAYGAEVVVTPTAVAPEHPDSYYSTAERLVRETPDSFRPDQYSNPANPAEHERSTGPEVWRQTAGRITHFVAGIGTGGSITGVGRYLKAQNPDVQVVGADPEGSVYSGGAGRPYLVEGVGEDFWPTTYDPSVVDRVIRVSDAESFAMARRVTREEGLLIGGSCGTAVHAAPVAGGEGGERGAERARPHGPRIRRRVGAGPAGEGDHEPGHADDRHRRACLGAGRPARPGGLGAGARRRPPRRRADPLRRALVPRV